MEGEEGRWRERKELGRKVRRGRRNEGKDGVQTKGKGRGE